MGRRLVLALVVLGAVPANAAAARVGPLPKDRQALISAGRFTVTVSGATRVTATLRTRGRTIAAARPATARRGRAALVLTGAARSALTRCAAPAHARLTVRAGGAHRSRTLACPPPVIRTPAPHGLEGMTALDRLPVLDPSVTVGATSSHARQGTNADFGPFLRRDDQGRYVLVDVTGPGALTRIWMTGALGGSPNGETSAFGRIQLFFDGETTPRVDLPARDFYAGRTSPFLSPLCGDFSVSSGGNYCGLRLPFAKSLIVATTGSPWYYDFGYERYPQGTPVTTFDPHAPQTVAAVQAAGALHDRHGSDPELLPHGTVHSGSRAIPAGGRATLADLSGAGTLRRIEVSTAAMRELWLEARWDGEARPSVAAPVSELFASGAGSHAPSLGLLVGWHPQQQRGYLYFPMPFARGARVELVNRSSSAQQASWTAEESPARYGGRVGEFHATYTEDPETDIGSDHVLLDAQGTGKVVGLSFTEEGPLSTGFTTFMEGDERVHVDGSRSPAVYGTGTEDYFGGAYYYATGPFALADHGLSAKLDTAAFRAQTAQYRLHLSDPWPFRDGLRFGMEHAAGDGEVTAVSAVVYWYGSESAAQHQTDVVAPPATPGCSAAPLTAFFEGDHDGNISSPFDQAIAGASPPPAGLDPLGEAVTDTVTTCPPQTRVAFSAQVDARNRGAVLRRMYDQQLFQQQAEVYVGGTYAGTWLDAGENVHKRWAESDFPLPASVTKGRTTLPIELRVTGPAGWTASRYTVFTVT